MRYNQASELVELSPSM
ncbi:hypothetical protein F383_34744 [Gossypium arboreum]|uniref:Uncharacterized protein n=1 Tax=Gossypium arboreum TaxID=29729 RepID=A0A0B0PSF4_GOSAR|nr:hypothetical protein F383_34744 [Gossypium arboreum]